MRSEGEERSGAKSSVVTEQCAERSTQRTDATCWLLRRMHRCACVCVHVSMCHVAVLRCVAVLCGARTGCAAHVAEGSRAEQGAEQSRAEQGDEDAHTEDG